MTEEKKYRCMMCGQIVVPNEDGSCPFCGAPKECLVPLEEENKEE